MAASLLADAHALGIQRLTHLECYRLTFIEGSLRVPDLGRLAAELLSDPVADTSHWRSYDGNGVAAFNGQEPETHVIEVALRPGVTDPVADQIARYARLLGIEGIHRAATGQRFELHGPLSDADLDFLARRLLANPVIHRYAFGPITPHFPEPAEASGAMNVLPVRELDDAELLAISRERRAALDLAEMQALQDYFRAEGRDPTDVEFETLAQTWSEHCVHKTFKALVDIRRPKRPEVGLSGRRPATSDLPVDGILRTYLRAATEKIAAPWVRSAFVDNAGVIDFDADHELSFKVETHNHPSAIEPFGGANTGVGGVIRDVLGVSARPIAATDILCFGLPGASDAAALPEGVLHPRRIRAGVVAGIQDYGNKIGLPTVNGAIWYDAGYTANPLVFCGCVGIAPKGSHPRSPAAGDRIIVLGGRTGRDGLRGATFSSMAMDAQTGEVAGASVQIGDPITEKGLIEVITRARDSGLYHAVTDCGAGGLSSAVGEMGSEVGAEVDLASVRLKYPGLAPWEIWLSEAQERMVLAVPPENLLPLQSLCDLYDVELTDIGVFTGSGRLIVQASGRAALDLDNRFLHAGLPRRRLTAELPSLPDASAAPAARLPSWPAPEFSTALFRLLAHPNLASKAAVIRGYDHEVQGGTVVKPLTGVANDGPADAAVLKPLSTAGRRGFVLSNGLNPEYGKRDPYRMAVSVVDEAIRNGVAVGADPDRIALLDNFCWGDPQRPETLGALVAAAQGCYDAALHYAAPFISGKDSLNNEYLGPDGRRHAIPPTLLISAIGLIDDVSQAVTSDLKAVGDLVYLVGALEGEFGGCHLAMVSSPEETPWSQTGPVPGLPDHAPGLYRALHAAMASGLITACHDLSEGGLAVCAAEMCIGGRLGLALDLVTGDPWAALYGERNGALLVTIRPAGRTDFEAQLSSLPYHHLGVVTDTGRMSIAVRSQPGLSLAVADLVAAWNTVS